MNQLSSLKMLIDSMTKGEKRHFRLYSQRIGRTTKKHYLTLYDILERGDYDHDEALKKRIKEPSLKKHLPYFKNLLFEMIMEGLQDMYRSEGVPVQLRRWLQQTELLVQRGMYAEAERLLMKAKEMAVHYECFEELLLLNKQLIVVWDLRGNETENISHLLTEQLGVVQKIEAETTSYQLYSQFICEVRKIGSSLSKAEQAKFETFKKIALKNATGSLGFMHEYRLLSFQSSFCFIVDNDGPSAFTKDKALLDLFERKKQFLSLYPLLYLKTMSNVVHNAIAYSPKEVNNYLDLLRKLVEKHPAFSTTHIKNEAERIILNLDLSIFWLNHQFEKLILLQPTIEAIYVYGSKPVDELKRQHLLLLLAISHLQLNQFEKALDFSLLVINEKTSPKYLETYFDSLLIKWIIYFQREDFEAVHSVYNSMRYLLKRNKSKDEVLARLVDLLSQIQRWNRTKEFVKVRIDKIKESLYLSEAQMLKRRYWILKRFVEAY